MDPVVTVAALIGKARGGRAGELSRVDGPDVLPRMCLGGDVARTMWRRRGDVVKRDLMLACREAEDPRSEVARGRGSESSAIEAHEPRSVPAESPHFSIANQDSIDLSVEAPDTPLSHSVQESNTANCISLLI